MRKKSPNHHRWITLSSYSHCGMSSLFTEALSSSFLINSLSKQVCCLEILCGRHKCIVSETTPSRHHKESSLGDLPIYAKTPSTTIQIRSNTTHPNTTQSPLQTTEMCNKNTSITTTTDTALSGRFANTPRCRGCGLPCVFAPYSPDLIYYCYHCKRWYPY